MYEATNAVISLAMAGDTILTRRLALFREPRFLRIREILQQADAAFANLEAPVGRYLDQPYSRGRSVGFVRDNRTRTPRRSHLVRDHHGCVWEQPCRRLRPRRHS